MSEKKRIKIVSDGLAINTKVLVDDKEMPNVKSITISIDADDGVARCMLEVYADDIEISGLTKVELRGEP